jgi:hypothetical protein
MLFHLGKLGPYGEKIILGWKVEGLARDKYSNLFQTFVTYGRKSLTKLTPGANVNKLFTDVSYEFFDRLEHLSLASLSSLV